MTDHDHPKPTFPPAYPSGRHVNDGVLVFDDSNRCVADLKDAIWWLFFGKDESENGHAQWVRNIVEELGQDHPRVQRPRRDPEGVARVAKMVLDTLDTQKKIRAKREAKERAEYERLRAKYEGVDA